MHRTRTANVFREIEVERSSPSRTSAGELHRVHRANLAAAHPSGGVSW